MAENESLNPSGPYGQRWKAVRDAIRKGEPREKVFLQAQRALYRGLRNTLKQCAEYGVTLQMLLDNRNSAQALRRFVKATQGHDYVHLFRDVAASSAKRDTKGLLGAYTGAILEAVFDRIAYQSVTRDGPTSLSGMRDYLCQVTEQLRPDVDRIAANLAEDPTSKPKMPGGKKAQPLETTAEILDMSLLGK